MKKVFTILAMLLLLATASQAQVFIMENEHNLRPDDPEELNSWPDMPQNASGYDYYLPVGEGLSVLTALGAGYLLAKRKKETNKIQ
jgi:hypothetical protein